LLGLFFVIYQTLVYKKVCNKHLITNTLSWQKYVNFWKLPYLFIEKYTFSLLKYFWICIKLMTLIWILSVCFNGNNTINYFTNNGFQVLKQKISYCHYLAFIFVHKHLKHFFTNNRPNMVDILHEWFPTLYVFHFIQKFNMASMTNSFWCWSFKILS
jgi:hypothetical protein